MHLLLIGMLVGFILYPVGGVLINKLKKKAEDI